MDTELNSVSKGKKSIATFTVIAVEGGYLVRVETKENDNVEYAPGKWVDAGNDQESFIPEPLSTYSKAIRYANLLCKKYYINEELSIIKRFKEARLSKELEEINKYIKTLPNSSFDIY